MNKYEQEQNMPVRYSMIVAMDSFDGIGKEGRIPWTLPDDLKRFSTITKGRNAFSNMVVMGRKTWDSLPEKFRPLPLRVNVVLTRQPETMKERYKFSQSTKEHAFFVHDVDRVHQIARRMNIENVYIIGGSCVYGAFAPKVQIVYVTRVYGDFHCDTFFPSVIRPCKVLKTESHPTHRYEQWEISLPMMRSNFVSNFDGSRVEPLLSMTSHDETYLKLLKHVLENGEERSDRTGTGTLSIFSPDPLRFDISETVPLLTTKKMGPKGIIKELLWFLRGDTDAKVLQQQGVHIWDGNTSREFLDKRGLSYEEGVVGPTYGWAFRRFGAEYDERYADSRNITPEISERLGGFDQLMYVEDLLKNDPESRRIYMNLWNARHLDKMALPPCHVGINFYVSKKIHLSCHVYIRSNDLFLGNPYNIFSYTVLVYILAKRCNLHPKELIISLGDAHIYKDHVEQVREQLDRTPLPAPRLKLSERIAKVDYADMTVDDFKIVGYQSHAPLKGKMSA